MSGPVPFGLRRERGTLVAEPAEAGLVRALVGEFLATGRMKSVAATLNQHGFRTRRGRPWSDMAVARALQTICVHNLVDEGLRARCAALLEAHRQGAPARRAVHPLGGVVACGTCSGRMYLFGSGPTGKFICRSCRTKIPAPTLEQVFVASLASISITPEEVCAACGDQERPLDLPPRGLAVAEIWPALGLDDRRQLVDAVVSEVVVADNEITVSFALTAASSAPSSDGPPVPSPSSRSCTSSKKKPTKQRNTKADRSAAPEESAGPLVTVEEAAALLRTSPKAIYAMAERGQLGGVVRVGRRLLFSREQLLHSLTGSRAPSPEETR
ncbi:MAG: helix-turn-helix domain-containing protein [Acidobacteria bacterium]|nr:helix-turn-helix domain-containing protein [Acidobacteriota bacterium]